jgi:hypothetical protein
MKGAGPNLHVVRLLQGATLGGPEFADFENNILKIHVIPLK